MFVPFDANSSSRLPSHKSTFHVVAVFILYGPHEDELVIHRNIDDLEKIITVCVSVH